MVTALLRFDTLSTIDQAVYSSYNTVTIKQGVTMTNELYSKVKATLIKYKDEFEQPHSFADLYGFSKQYGHGLTFKAFVRVVQNMGVASDVKRFDNGTKRVLTYNPQLDQYLNGEIDIVGTCDKCNGTGIIKVKLKKS